MGHSNAFTAEDMTVYMNSVPCKSLEMVLEKLIAWIPAIRKDIFQTEKKVIIEEYHTYMNNFD